MFKFQKWCRLLPMGLLLGSFISVLASPAYGSDHANFKTVVQPILQKHCLECHVQGQKGFEESGLDVSTYKDLMKGTNYGAIIVPGDAFTSNLMVLIEGRADISIQMPHSRKGLSKWEKLMLRRWINRGALNN